MAEICKFRLLLLVLLTAVLLFPANSLAQCCASQSAIAGCQAAGGTWDSVCCCCHPPCCSPIILDVDNSGFQLTSVKDGVYFDLDLDQDLDRLGWTAIGSTNAFLALDRNGNGVIDNGSELFGDHTLQPPSSDPNGFLALAEFDKPENGGNGDGIIDHNDAVYSRLRLWIDKNHDGISQPDELFTLPEMGIYSISLDYQVSRRKDEFGNLFRYAGRVNEGLNTKAGRWAYDVFLVHAGQ